MTDSREFVQQMTRLGTAYRKPMSTATIEVYYQALGSLAPADLAGAVTWAIKSSKFLPTPSEILARGQYERTSRLRALPPADVAAIPEWVLEPEADVPALMAELLPKLSAASKRMESSRPATNGHDGPTMSADERVQKAQAELARYRAYLGGETA